MLALLPAQARDAFLSLGREHTYAAGQILLSEGSTNTRVLLLVDASVKVSATTPDGQETLLAVRHSGDLIGELSGLDGQPCIATVTAVGSAAVSVIPRHEFLAFLHQHPSVAVAVSRHIAERLRAATRRRVDLAGVPVLVRLCRVLAEWCEQAGGAVVRVPLTQHELAALVGASEVSVSRALRPLVRAGAVSTGYRCVQVCEPAQVRKIAEGGDVPPPPGGAGNPVF
ncbi:Crp/Fnr family transcriptional regulator [Streptomyces actinomycinicus]|uniref:Crp/Fnr family transcriptional regulator n=1 Tax=Streptomyces actinomycinicus TaxID=1695166 RepID=A0A937EJP1_9ACTN|nr:Crp/Fnr family transcriptional regulator [Streptomyces actinomycinicus]MBL1083505.1 Crp/Fnr family transcriptional regulator [Streptomyces actinomycinicus]